MADVGRLAGGAGLHSPDPDPDDTIRIAPPVSKPPLLTSRRAWIAGAGILGTACLLRGVSSLVLVAARAAGRARRRCGHSGATGRCHAGPRAGTPLPRPPGLPIQTATEQEILRHVPTGLTVFRFADDQRILVLDFASLHQQGMMLNRVAALIEKAGQPRNRVLSDSELAAGDPRRRRHAGNLLLRPRLQRRVAPALLRAGGRWRICRSTREEATLRRLLHQADWFKPGAHAGLISIPAVGADANVTLSARGTILHHELSHGMFFGDPDYASFVHAFWRRALTGEERGGVRRFLGSEGYDTSYEELMYNEMQAYLMFTRDPEFFTPERVGMTHARGWRTCRRNSCAACRPAGCSEALAATPVLVPAAAHGR